MSRESAQDDVGAATAATEQALVAAGAPPAMAATGAKAIGDAARIFLSCEVMKGGNAEVGERLRRLSSAMAELAEAIEDMSVEADVRLTLGFLRANSHELRSLDDCVTSLEATYNRLGQDIKSLRPLVTSIADRFEATKSRPSDVEALALIEFAIHEWRTATGNWPTKSNVSGQMTHPLLDCLQTFTVGSPEHFGRLSDSRYRSALTAARSRAISA